MYEKQEEKLRELDDVDDYLVESLDMDPTQIKELFCKIPGEVAYWNYKLALASRDLMKAKANMEQQEARLNVELREELSEKGKVTEAMVTAAVTQHEHYKAAKLRLINAEADKLKIGAAVEAVRTKREVLISLGAHVRLEMEADPKIMDQHKNRRAG